MPLKGTVPAPATAQTALQPQTARGQTSTPVTTTGGGRRQAQFTVDPVAANAGVQRALAKFNANPNATYGSGQSRRQITLRDRIADEFGLNKLTQGGQIDALLRFATQPQAPSI